MSGPQKRNERARVGSAFGALDGHESKVARSESTLPPLTATARNVSGSGPQCPNDRVPSVVGDTIYSTHTVKVAVAEGRDDEARVARWPEAAVHTVTVVLGAGVLSLPYATAQVGLALGAVLLTVACLASYYSAHLLAHLADYDGDVPSEGGNGPEAGSTVDCGSSAGSKKRLATYGDIGVAAFGDTLGRWLTVPFQWMVLVGVSIIFFGLGGQSLAGVVEYVSSVILAGGASIPGETKPVVQWPWKLLFTVLCMLASPLGGIHESFWISALSGSVSVNYYVIPVSFLSPLMAK